MYELCKFLIKELNREIGETKQFYTKFFYEEEVSLLQSDKRRLVEELDTLKNTYTLIYTMQPLVIFKTKFSF